MRAWPDLSWGPLHPFLCLSFPMCPGPGRQMRDGGAGAQVIAVPGDAGVQAREGAPGGVRAGGGGAGSGRGRRLPRAWAPAPPRLLPPPALAPVRSPAAPGPASDSDSASPPPVPSSPGRPPGPLPRHEEAVGEEAFPGEGSGGGRRREGVGRAGHPEGGRVTAAGPGEGALESRLSHPGR